jgi:glycosyltransferase involved in cell wall biosynthesis
MKWDRPAVGPYLVKMKFVHLNTNDSGGSWVYARTLSDALGGLGHDSCVLTRGGCHRPISDKFLRKGTLALTKGAWHGTRRTHAPPATELHTGADVVVLHTVADWFDVPAWVESNAGRFQIIVVMHDLWHVSGGCFVYGRCERFRHDCRPCSLLKAPVSGFLADHEQKRKASAYQKAGVRFLANSQWLKDLVQDSPMIHGKEITVIPPAVDPQVFYPQDRAACRETLGIAPDAMVVATGCASLTDENKDTPGLLRMLGDMELAGLVVLVFGEGEIPSPAGLDVRWLGPQEKKGDLARIYGAADVFASASRMETYGLTLAEAYACGCAVVAHAAGGIPEALPNDPSVSLSAVGDRVAFITALRGQLTGRVAQLPFACLERSVPRAPTPFEAAEKLQEVCDAGNDPYF